MALEFRDLEVSDQVESKINGVHHVSIDNVLDALESVIDSEWDHDLERGTRLYVWGLAGRRVIFVCLWPLDIDGGSWRLATAYPDAHP